MTVPFWTDERVEELKCLLKEGLSCSQIGRKLGCTRNAVIGKAHRIQHATGVRLMNEKPRRVPGSPIAGCKPKRPYTRRSVAPSLASDTGGFVMPVAVLPPPAPLPVADTSRACGIVDLTGCRWPVGHDDATIGGHIFCNAEKHDERYCAVHADASRAPYSRELIRKTIKQVQGSMKRASA